MSVTVDNTIYDRMADGWWDEGSFLHTLKRLIPGRLAYFNDVFRVREGWDPRGKKLLDVGCGGGLTAEEFSRMGCVVSGVDPSEASLDAARRHNGDEQHDHPLR